MVNWEYIWNYNFVIIKVTLGFYQMLDTKRSDVEYRSIKKDHSHKVVIDV